jgi:hypothetical protein
MFDKEEGHYNRARCNSNTPGKWHRFSESIRNYGTAKRRAFECLLKKSLQLARV